MSSNDFCPECSTLLHPEEIFIDDEESDSETEDEKKTSGLYLVCGECSYKEKTNSFSTYHFSNKVEKIQYIHPKRLVEDYIYDMTYPRTKTKSCTNSTCPTNGKENPIIILITSEDHPEIAYLCTVCKNIWGSL
jgi:DNA-directed RNA polymerase subunit M/transcription elongation factor TFIIS